MSDAGIKARKAKLIAKPLDSIGKDATSNLYDKLFKIETALLDKKIRIRGGYILNKTMTVSKALKFMELQKVVRSGTLPELENKWRVMLTDPVKAFFVDNVKKICTAYTTAKKSNRDFLDAKAQIDNFVDTYPSLDAPSKTQIKKAVGDAFTQIRQKTTARITVKQKAVDRYFRVKINATVTKNWDDLMIKSETQIKAWFSLYKKNAVNSISEQEAYLFEGITNANSLAWVKGHVGKLLDDMKSIVLRKKTQFDDQKAKSKVVNPTIIVTPSITAPDAPTAVKAVSVSPGQARVSFEESTDDGGSAILNYRVSVVGGTISKTTITSPIVVDGLTNGEEYKFTVVAVNKEGDSASVQSNSVTPAAPVTVKPSTTKVVNPATAPGAPTDVSAKEGDGKATVSFTEPASNGGSPIEEYR
eukprot:266905_1